MVEDLYYKAAHYNLKCKTGALLNRVTASDICGILPQDVEWIWIEEELLGTPRPSEQGPKRQLKGRGEHVLRHGIPEKGNEVVLGQVKGAWHHLAVFPPREADFFFSRFLDVELLDASLITAGKAPNSRLAQFLSIFRFSHAVPSMFGLSVHRWQVLRTCSVS
jgi:hypothetical protein